MQEIFVDRAGSGGGAIPEEKKNVVDGTKDWVPSRQILFVKLNTC